MGVIAKATGLPKVPKIMLSKSLDGDSAEHKALCQEAKALLTHRKEHDTL